VWFLFVMVAIGLAVNLFRLQVTEAAMLQTRARSQQSSYVRPFVPRRPIVDRNGDVLAIDRPVYTLYAHPTLFKASQEEVASHLASLLEQSQTELLEAMTRGESGIELAYALPENIARRLRDLMIKEGLDGLELVQHPQRLYPQADLFAHVLGFVDIDQAGRAGLEATLQAKLERTPQELHLARTGTGAILPRDIPAEFFQSDTSSLQTTLDARLQRIARVSLHEKMSQFQAKRGAVLVMDVNTGEMPILVTEPSYDPNRYSEANIELFRNWTVTDLYEPGSTFKPINVAIALETGAVDINDSFYDEGQIYVGEWPIQNYDYEDNGGRGQQSVTDIVAFSSNVGMVHMMEQVDAATYFQWLQKLEIEEPTGIELPSEMGGQLKDKEQFVSSAIEPATTAFGQGFSLTPLKLLQLHATVANGGNLVTPHLVRGMVDPEGNLGWQPDLPAERAIFSQDTSQQVLGTMEAVVSQGTGTVAQIPGYRLAGKTGTAQKASPDGGYLEGARITSFVTLFPANQPRYALLVIIDEPQGDDAYGSTVAAPVAKTIVEALIAADQIPPSGDRTPIAPSTPPELNDSTPEEPEQSWEPWEGDTWSEEDIWEEDTWNDEDTWQEEAWSEDAWQAEGQPEDAWESAPE
jgi:cell division protein FtsI (penicillin-binding protein 3)